MKKGLVFDIFCRVIDNYGDVGVCWRLATDLASRQHQVNLWVDNLDVLTWLAAGTQHNRIKINLWTPNLPAIAVGDVLIEAFGCRLDDFVLADSFSQSTNRYTVWLNLEYLTAENFAADSHLLASPCLAGNLLGKEKYFFYPGFEKTTGGLLREPDLFKRRQHFSASAWLAKYQLQPRGKIISLFCYEPANLTTFLQTLLHSQQEYCLLVTAGRSQTVIKQVWQLLRQQFSQQQLANIQLVELPFLSQLEFDHLLWSCDLNFVRGEDSLVRAIWAGKPFIWQIYQQHDKVHFNKLEAFLTFYLTTTEEDLRQTIANWFAFWNAEQATCLTLDVTQLFSSAWQEQAQKISWQLYQQADLTSNLLKFVNKKILINLNNGE